MMALIEVLRTHNPETDPDCHEAADRIITLEQQLAAKSEECKRLEAKVKELREAIIDFDTIFHDMCWAGDAGVFGDNETKTLAKAISRYQKAVQAASTIPPTSTQADEKED